MDNNVIYLYHFPLAFFFMGVLFLFLVFETKYYFMRFPYLGFSVVLFLLTVLSIIKINNDFGSI